MIGSSGRYGPLGSPIARQSLSPSIKDANIVYTYWVLQLLNSLTFASLLFMLASGFTLIFGLMRIINLAHGAFYLLGGYIGISVLWWTGSFWLAIVGAGLSIGLIGLLLDSTLFVRVRGEELPEVLLTIGVAFVIGDLCLIIWGGDPLSVPTPEYLSGPLMLGGLVFPKYRLFLVAVAIGMALLLFVIHRYTRMGAIIRAGVDDRELVDALGINVNLAFTAVFFVGAALAGFAGVFGGAFLSLYPGADMEILLYALVVVTIGGMGSLQGAVVGSLLVGLLDIFGKAFFPELSYFTIFGPMVLILAFWPQGLFGRS